MEGNWWNALPLPPHYEAKYDANSRRYFYINHSNRSTTWDDPRPNYYTQNPSELMRARQWQTSQTQSSNTRNDIQLRQFSSSQPSAQGRTTTTLDLESSESESSDDSDESISDTDIFSKNKFSEDDLKKLRQRYSRASESILKTALEGRSLFEACQYIEHRFGYKATGDEQGVKLATIKLLFPNVEEEVLMEIMISANNNSKECMKTLRQLGYKASGTAGMKKQFPSAPDDVILDVMASCECDFDKSKKALKDMGYQQGGAQQKPKTTSPQKSQKTKSSVSFVPSKDSVMPDSQLMEEMQKLFKDCSAFALRNILIENKNDRAKVKAALKKKFVETPVERPAAQTSALSPSTTSTSSRPSSASTNFTGSTISFPAKSTTKQSSSRPQSSRAGSPKKTTRSKHQSKSAYTRPKISSGGYVSELRTTANGPNSSLYHGPDSSLLNSDYVTAAGPDSSLARGPCVRAEGSAGAQGPDCSLISHAATFMKHVTVVTNL